MLCVTYTACLKLYFLRSFALIPNFKTQAAYHAEPVDARPRDRFCAYAAHMQLLHQLPLGAGVSVCLFLQAPQVLILKGVA